MNSPSIPPSPAPSWAAAIRCRACRRRRSIARWSRWSRSSATPAAGMTPSPPPAIRGTTTTRAIPAMSTAARTSTGCWRPTGWSRASAGRRSTISTTRHRRPEPALSRRAVVAARRLYPHAGAHRSRLRVLGLPRRHRSGQRLGPDRHPRAHLFRQAAIFESGGLSHDPRCRTPAHPGNRFPRALLETDPQFRGIPRLLAADPLQRGACRGILGLPRGGRRHGPVAAAQVRGHRTRRRSAAAVLPDPRHAAAVARPGRLHRHVLRAWRHDRRRHGAAARAGQFPLDRR
jgi:hypothetical protein